MALTRLRFLSCLLIAVLVFPFPAAGFDTTLSDTALREAYFIGQRHDETTLALLDKYTTHLPPPKKGPYIDAVSFLSPFAQVVLNSANTLTVITLNKPNSTTTARRELSKLLSISRSPLLMGLTPLLP